MECCANLKQILESQSNTMQFGQELGIGGTIYLLSANRSTWNRILFEMLKCTLV